METPSLPFSNPFEPKTPATVEQERVTTSSQPNSQASSQVASVNAPQGQPLAPLQNAQSLPAEILTPSAAKAKIGILKRQVQSYLGEKGCNPDLWWKLRGLAEMERKVVEGEELTPKDIVTLDAIPWDVKPLVSDTDVPYAKQKKPQFMVMTPEEGTKVVSSGGH